MKKRTRNIWLFIILVFAVLQLFPIEKANPATDPAEDFMILENPPEPVKGLLKNACYDCHSNLTKYPWYTNIQPVAWWVRGHIDNGRRQLNFSEWRQYSEDDKHHAWEEMAEVVEETRMPLTSYWIAHPEAKLSEEQREQLVGYFKGGGEK